MRFQLWFRLGVCSIRVWVYCWFMFGLCCVYFGLYAIGFNVWSILWLMVYPCSVYVWFMFGVCLVYAGIMLGFDVVPFLGGLFGIDVKSLFKLGLVYGWCMSVIR